MSQRYVSYRDGDRRSRSPSIRDRSPTDRFDRASQYSDGDRRRSSAEARANLPRDTPRGPRAYMESQNSGRGGSFTGGTGAGSGPGSGSSNAGVGAASFDRGRGARGGRGRPWPPRDHSRDRGREREESFRDRRDFPSRDERSRERDRERERDRDWRNERETFRRRPSPGRGRSPPRDFAREREPPPLGVDAERSRRGSRDGGPPSAGSSNSDQQFSAGPLSRGGGFSRGRGGTPAGRGGRGDWDSRGRGRSAYYDDRYPRSRSQEGRYGYELDGRERGDRYMDSDPRRDPRDDRDNRDRDSMRPKLERSSLSHEPSPINVKDVSPPPLAPPAPQFGSVQVPNRPAAPAEPSSGGSAPSAAPIGGGTTARPIPTAPRADRERPLSAGHPGAADAQQIPTGPSRPLLADGSPTIPLGPRLQHKQQRPSSKQWINPNLVGKKPPDSPKVMRSHSFVQQQRPFSFRDQFQPGDQDDHEYRPRSSDAKSESHITSADSSLRDVHMTEPGEVISGREAHSARTSIDPETRPYDGLRDTEMGGMDQPTRVQSTRSPDLGAVPAKERVEELMAASIVDAELVSTPLAGLIAPRAQPAAVEAPTSPPQEESQGSDEEDMGDYFADEISKAEADLDKLEGNGKVPTHIIGRYAKFTHLAMAQILHHPVSVSSWIGPLPEGFKLSRAKAKSKDAAKRRGERQTDAAGKTLPMAADTLSLDTASSSGTAAPATTGANESLPDAAVIESATTIEPAPKSQPPDVEMKDVPSIESAAADLQGESAKGIGILISGPTPLLYPSTEPTETVDDEKGLPSTPSQMEEDEEEDTESDDPDAETIERVRQPGTPPVESLPHLDCRKWTQDRDFLNSLTADETLDEFVLEHLHSMSIEKGEKQAEARKQYAEGYVNYLHFTMSDDPIAAKSRDKFSVTAPATEAIVPATTVPESKPEGRTAGRRFASERDLERVMAASMQEEQERKAREERLQKEKYRSEKEAVIPEMYSTEEERERDLYVDEAGLLPPEQLVAGWQILPPVDNFTEQETELFEKTYLEHPKQWGKVAEAIPHRDFKACIQYYYLKKKELNLKEKLRKQPKKRKRGRGKQRSSALVSELGNGEDGVEEQLETGENGERRRPRRAAAPTFGSEQPPTDSDNATPAGTPGRRGAGAAAKGGEAGVEKPDGRKSRKRAVKEKEPKPAKGAAQSLAPTPAATGGRGGRSRSTSRVQNPEFQPPQSVPAESTRPFDGPPAPIAPPFVPVAPPPQPPVMVPERPVPPPGQSTLSEVMAPPALRPDPPPPPQHTVVSFESAPPATERRPTQQASSYWSVSEVNEFPAFLRSFGTDWTSIATHMGSKTAIMVKNYWVRQKDSQKPEWEEIARDADAKKARGEKLPDPPAPTLGSGRKKYDQQPPINRPLAAAAAPEPAGEPGPALESSNLKPPYAARFPVVPIAPQAPPVVQAPLAQSTPPQSLVPVPPHSQPPAVSKVMSPNTHPLRAPAQPFATFPPDREREAPPAQQAVRISQKPVAPPVTEPGPQRPLAAAQPMQAIQPTQAPQAEPMPARQDAMLKRAPQEQHVRMESDYKQSQRIGHEARDHPRMQETQPPLRVKQEPDIAPPAPPPPHYEAYPHHQQTVRQAPQRQEPVPHSRQPEPPRSVAPPPPPPAPQPYTQPVQQQPMRNILGEPAQAPPVAPPSQRPISAMQQSRQVAPQAQETFKEPYPPPAPPQPVVATPTPPPSRPKTSSLMALLNDDPPAAAPPKRVADVGTSIKSQTPPPQAQAMSTRPPPPAPAPSSLRRETEQPYGPYSRNPPSAVQSAMPSLKPYTASPQPHHMSAPRQQMASPLDAAPTERDYYRAQQHYPPQHPPSSSPQGGHHYPPPAQQQQVPYQPQSAYPYGPTSQPHAASPPPQYAVDPRGRPPPREQPPPSRENAWPPNPQGHGIPQAQQPSQPQMQQQQQQGWPAPPPKSTQAPPPTQPAWVDSRVASKPPQGSSVPPQPQAWPQAPPPQPQQPHHMAMRDERSVYASSSPAPPPMAQHQHAPPPQHQQHAQHQHQHSMSGRYGAPPQDRRAPEPAPQSYRGYPTGPAPVAPREAGPGPGPVPSRSYTPSTPYDPRPPPGPYPPQQPPDPREAQMRDMVRDPRAEQMLQRPLRPHDPYDQRPPQPPPGPYR